MRGSVSELRVLIQEERNVLIGLFKTALSRLLKQSKIGGCIQAGTRAGSQMARREGHKL
jgi:hypothetical protein